MEVMKKQNLLLVLMLVFLPYASMFAFDFEVDGVCYNKLSDSEVEVTDKSDGYTGEVFIPSTISYNDVIYSVIGIGSKAFANSSARIRSGKDHKPNSVTMSLFLFDNAKLRRFSSDSKKNREFFSNLYGQVPHFRTNSGNRPKSCPKSYL